MFKRLKNISIDAVIFLVPLFYAHMVFYDEWDDSYRSNPWVPSIVVTAIAYVVAFLFASNANYAARSVKQRLSVMGLTFLFTMLYWIGLRILFVGVMYWGVGELYPFIGMFLGLVCAIAVAWRRIKSFP